MELIDISNVNGPVDWPKVFKAGIWGVWLKATEGISFDDAFYSSNKRRAESAGLRVGAYHFARPDNNSAKAEAAHFCRVIGKVGRRDLKPALDFETRTKRSATELEAWAREFNHIVRETLGVTPVFYSYPSYISDMRLSKTIGNGLWLASYGNNNGLRKAAVPPKPWKRYVAQQYTSRGVVSGCSGNVDRSWGRVTGCLAHPLKGLLPPLGGRGTLNV